MIFLRFCFLVYIIIKNNMQYLRVDCFIILIARRPLSVPSIILHHGHSRQPSITLDKLARDVTF